MTMERGADFLLAIKEATQTTYDKDAAEFLDGLAKVVSLGCDQMKVTGERRDRMMFFEGMLRGVQVKLARARLETGQELHDRGINPRQPPGNLN
jgi:hypothetical protein